MAIIGQSNTDTDIVARAAIIEREADKAIRTLQKVRATAVNQRITGEQDEYARERNLQLIVQHNLIDWFDNVLNKIDQRGLQT
jgi:hypothetical protein